MRVRLLTALCLTALGAAAGCASTRVQSVWEAPNLNQVSAQRALVVGMLKEETARRTYETTLVNRLRAQGIPAEESFRYIDLSADLNRENLRPLAQQHGFDVVFVGRVTKVRQQIQSIPADTWSTMDAWGFYNYGWYDSRYMTRVPVVNVETQLYRVNHQGAGELVWAAVSESFDPSSSVEMAKTVAEGVAKRVTKDVTFETRGLGGSGPPEQK